MFGLTADDVAEEVEVWECHAQALDLFRSMSTQWRVGGMGLPVGLDYNILYRKMDRLALSADRYDELEFEVAQLEAGAFDGMREAHD